jgi:hypothetical protein
MACSCELLDWFALGEELRASALDAHEGQLPDVDFAYSFLLDNPECFDQEEWPDDMPKYPPSNLIVSYYGEWPEDSYPEPEPLDGLNKAVAVVVVVWIAIATLRRIL